MSRTSRASGCLHLFSRRACDSIKLSSFRLMNKSNEVLMIPRQITSFANLQPRVWRGDSPMSFKMGEGFLFNLLFWGKKKSCLELMVEIWVLLSKLDTILFWSCKYKIHVDEVKAPSSSYWALRHASSWANQPSNAQAHSIMWPS